MSHTLPPLLQQITEIAVTEVAASDKQSPADKE